MSTPGQLDAGLPTGKATPPDPQARPKDQDVREHLQRVLKSAAFRGSKRGTAFLEYTVEKVLAGQGDTIKERSLAVEVFGRSPESDLSEDSIVRVGAREVRRRLSQYYTSPEAAGDKIEIELPGGSYIPEFKSLHPVAASPSPLVRRSRMRFLVAAGIVALAGLCGLWLYLRDPSRAAFDAFWKPFMRSGPPVIVAVAHPIVYHPSPHAVHLDEERRPLVGFAQRAIQVPPDRLNGSDFVPIFGQYVGFGDMVAVAELSKYFALQSRPLRMRLASSTEFADLREAPAILIGAYSNRWTLQFTQDLHFRFGRTHEGRPAIIDSSQSARFWTISGTGDDGSDYILLSRFVKCFSGNPIVIAAGLKQFGTEAAGRVLANPAQLGAVLQGLPENWQGKNMQVVLQARIIGNTPAPPEVVASYLW
jgi:hypothetical protein